MTAYSRLTLPYPQSPEAFEDLCCDLWRRLWHDSSAQKNGRRGQKQHGVDIFGKAYGGWRGVQCKHKDQLLQKKLSQEVIEEEIEQAKAFSPPLQHLIVATTAPRDAALQEAVRLLSDANEEHGLFTVSIAFWEDIVAELIEFPDLLSRYYSEFVLVLERKRATRLVVFAVVGLILAFSSGLVVRSWWVERLNAAGVVLLEHGRWAEARDRFRAALRLDRNRAGILSNLAATEERLGDLQAAETYYREALRQRPDSAEHLFNLGHFLNGRERYADAYPLLLQATVKDPARVDAYGELARASLGLALIGRARVALSTGLRLEPDRPALHRLYGELELQAGQPQAAIPHLEAARNRYGLGDLGRIETSFLLIRALDLLDNVPAVCREIRELRRLDTAGISPWQPAVEAIATKRHCPLN